MISSRIGLSYCLSLATVDRPRERVELHGFETTRIRGRRLARLEFQIGVRSFVGDRIRRRAKTTAKKGAHRHPRTSTMDHGRGAKIHPSCMASLILRTCSLFVGQFSKAEDMMNANKSVDDDSDSISKDLFHHSSSQGDDEQRRGPLNFNSNSTRTFMELRVGKSHLVEVLLQVRRADLGWYRSNYDTIQEELLELLQENVLPRMCGQEIENYHRMKHPHLFPPDIAGSKNNNKASSKAKTKSGKPAGRRRGKKGPPPPPPEQEEKPKPEKEVYYSFGETIQLAYRRQELPPLKSSNRGATIFYKAKEKGKFLELSKLSHRILIWCCSKLSSNLQNKTNPDIVGFHRPELIPIASLFREPKEEGV
jgi:hypothetical protein